MLVSAGVRHQPASLPVWTWGPNRQSLCHSLCLCSPETLAATGLPLPFSPLLCVIEGFTGLDLTRSGWHLLATLWQLSATCNDYCGYGWQLDKGNGHEKVSTTKLFLNSKPSVVAHIKVILFLVRNLNLCSGKLTTDNTFFSNLSTYCIHVTI